MPLQVFHGTLLSDMIFVHNLGTTAHKLPQTNNRDATHNVKSHGRLNPIGPMGPLFILTLRARMLNMLHLLRLSTSFTMDLIEWSSEIWSTPCNRSTIIRVSILEQESPDWESLWLSIDIMFRSRNGWTPRSSAHRYIRHLIMLKLLIPFSMNSMDTMHGVRQINTTIPSDRGKSLVIPPFIFIT